VTLKEYVERMAESQKYIYYATGESIERIEKMPHTEVVADKGFEILYFTDDVDEFAIKMIEAYEEKEFRNVSSGDLGLESEEEKKEIEEEEKEQKPLFDKMKEILAQKVKDVKASPRLRTHPVCFSADGDISIEMEKVLQQMPDGQAVKADKVLEINPNHPVYEALKRAYETDDATFTLYTELLYNQAILIEDLPMEEQFIKRNYKPAIVIVSRVLSLAIGVLAGMPGYEDFDAFDITILPLLNAILNSFTFVFLLIALFAILRGNVKWHKRFIYGA